MPSALTIFLAALGVLFALVLALLWLILRMHVSPLLELRGPPSPSFLFGNFKEISSLPEQTLHEKWVEIYGKTMTYKDILSINRLFTMDLKATNYILHNPDTFGKPKFLISALHRMVGKHGILVAQGDEHRRQKKIMGPAFGPGQVRELTSVFLEKAMLLRDTWIEILERNYVDQEKSSVELLSWMGRLALDIIGVAGFDYDFQALEGKENELSSAFAQAFRTDESESILSALQDFLPNLCQRLIRNRRDQARKIALLKMGDIADRLVQTTKESVQSSTWSSKNQHIRRDLLTLLVQAEVDGQRLDDVTISGQVPNFIAAGHETTSTSLTWLIYALSRSQSIQDLLREEILSVKTTMPSMEELNALPYLDKVIRESLRLYPAAPSVTRSIEKDDEIPVQDPYYDRNGHQRHSIRVEKGDWIFIPIMAINRSKEIWGEDAHEFNPDRWNSIPKAAENIPGVWGNSLTFLSGPKACIGYRFALIEIKAVVFILFRAFRFKLTIAPEDVSSRTFIVLRPVILSDMEGGNQLKVSLELI